jgi:hypothetical protein
LQVLPNQQEIKANNSRRLYLLCLMNTQSVKDHGYHISTYILNFRNKEHYLKTLQIKIQDVILEAPRHLSQHPKFVMNLIIYHCQNPLKLNYLYLLEKSIFIRLQKLLKLFSNDYPYINYYISSSSLLNVIKQWNIKALKCGHLMNINILNVTFK